MRLSRAILVMLLLHVVAVGGILAFSLIKEQNSDKGVHSSGGAVEADDSLLAPTKTVPMAETPPPGGKTLVHVVQPGETLLRIANDNGVTVEALITANGARTAMSSLRPGQELRLPEKSPDPASVATEHPSAGTDRVEDNPPSSSGTPTTAGGSKNGRLPPDSGKIYTVGKGESPYGIAQKLKVSYEALLKLNHIDDPKKLKPGQKLRIPMPASSKS